MQKAANDVMQSIIFSAIIDAVAALKRASGGLPNQLLRDVQAIHPNITLADLPKELQDQIAESTRSGPASKCSSRARLIGCRSGSGPIGGDRHEGRRRAIAVAAVRPRGAATVEEGVREAAGAASHAVELGGVSG